MMEIEPILCMIIENMTNFSDDFPIFFWFDEIEEETILPQQALEQFLHRKFSL